MKASRLAIVTVLVFLAALGPGRAATQEPAKGKSWAERKLGLKGALPKRAEQTREKLRRLRVERRPRQVLTGNDNTELWSAITRFYDFIKGRELDVYEEQEGLPQFFPDQAAYYDFLDTILPPMRDRRFERNRILAYRVHEITPAAEDPHAADVLISADSDDLLPFGKLIIFRERWLLGNNGWYPGKVSAESATYWERVR